MPSLEMETASLLQEQSRASPLCVRETSILPPELWLQVFSHLPSDDLPATTLTTSTFRTLAQPLLFSVLDVSPFFLAYEGSGDRILRPRKYLDRTIERLKFYCSPRIAPAVQHCWISPYSRNGFPPRNPRDYLEPRLLVDAIVKRLPALTNLRQLSWHCLNISAEWWDVIRQLNISVVWLNSCTIEDGRGPTYYPKTITLDHWAWKGEVINHVSIHERQSTGVAAEILPLILHPQKTNHISIAKVDTSNRLISTMAEMDPFVALKVLRVPFSSAASPCFIRALMHCSTLEELQFLPPVDGESHEIVMDLLPPSALPRLSAFEGPYTHLLMFASGRPLTRITTWGFDDASNACNPDKLAEALSQLNFHNSVVESIQTFVSHITDDLLSVIFSFSLIKHVEVASADALPWTSGDTPFRLSSETPMIVLYILLRKIRLPPKLETLRISTKLIPGNLDTPTQESEASRLIEGMAQTLPMLRFVEIVYGTHLTGRYQARWNRSSSSGEDRGRLGKLVFNEHKRMTVFKHSRIRLSEDESGMASFMIKFSLFTWIP